MSYLCNRNLWLQYQQRSQRRGYFINALNHLRMDRKIQEDEASSVKEECQKLNTLKEERKRLQEEYNAQTSNIEEEQVSHFSQKIAQIKQLASKRITTIWQQAKQKKQRDESQLNKLEVQIKGAEAKNKQLASNNTQLEQQIGQFMQSMGKCTTELRNEYCKKVQNFEQIYQSSKDRVRQLEEEENREDFVEYFCSNKSMMEAMMSNSQIKNQKLDQIIQEYQELLEAKKQIKQEILKSIQMKENEVVRMNQVEGQCRLILDRINEDKNRALHQNTHMHAQLMKAKDLIVSRVQAP